MVISSFMNFIDGTKDIAPCVLRNVHKVPNIFLVFSIWSKKTTAGLKKHTVGKS